MSQVNPKKFEDAMKALARQIWLPRRARNQGGTAKIAGPITPELGETQVTERDRDFLLETMEGTKYLEISCRNDLAKAKKDLPKLKSFVLERRKSGENAQGYWITLDEITADARTLFDNKVQQYKKYITPLSAKQF